MFQHTAAHTAVLLRRTTYLLPAVVPPQLYINYTEHTILKMSNDNKTILNSSEIDYYINYKLIEPDNSEFRRDNKSYSKERNSKESFPLIFP